MKETETLLGLYGLDSILWKQLLGSLKRLYLNFEIIKVVYE